MQYVKLIVASGTYKKLCSLFDFLLSTYEKPRQSDFRGRISWWRVFTVFLF